MEVPAPGGLAAPAPTPEKKKVKPALIAGIAALVVVAVGVGMALGGGGSPAQEGSGDPISEALAPKVTIGGEAYSTALTELELDGTDLTDADFEALQEFPNLTKLEITYPEGLGLSDLTPLSGLTNLTYLRVRTQGLTSLDGIETLTRLETLNIDGQDATFPSLEPLGHLTELKNLRLPIYKADLNIFADLTPLANCPHLESLQNGPQGYGSVPALRPDAHGFIESARRVWIYDERYGRISVNGSSAEFDKFSIPLSAEL